jgi:hypothetical protein
MIAEPTPEPAAPSPIARRPATIGLVLGVLSALASVVWALGIPLGVVAVVLSWRAAQQARGRDLRTISLAVGGIVVGTAGVLLGAGSAIINRDDGAADPVPVVINGIETATPDAEHQPPLDLEPGAHCTVDLDGLHADGKITNHTTKAWDYIVKVVWEDSGATLAEGTTVLRAVAPGATAPFESTSPDKTGTAATTCRVRGIDRVKPDR